MSAFKVVCVMLALMLCAAHARAEKNNCYFTLSGGQSKVQGIKTGFEDRIFDNSFVTGGYQQNGGSHPVTIGGGCAINKYVRIEGDYRDGFEFSISSRGKIVYRGVELADFDFERFAKVRAFGVSVVGQFAPFATDRVHVFGRVGVLIGKETVGLRSSAFPEGWEITKEKTGYLPMLGGGVDFVLTKSTVIFFEHTRYTDGNKFYANYIGFRWIINQ